MSKNAEVEMDVERVKKLIHLILSNLGDVLVKEYKDKGRSEKPSRGELLAALAFAAHALDTVFFDGVPNYPPYFIADMMCSLSTFLDQPSLQKGGGDE